MVNLGVVGSAFQLSKGGIEIAKRVGQEIAKQSKVNLFMCFDPDSLPMEVGKELMKVKKPTCFVCDEKEEKTAKRLGFKTINTGLPRLSRELVFVKSVDVLFVLGGGSGTLMEVTFAYQMNKKIFVLDEVSGAVDVFMGKFLDKRERVRVKVIQLSKLKSFLRSISS